MYLQRQHFLLSYFKTLSVGPAGVERKTSCMTAGCLKGLGHQLGMRITNNRQQPLTH